VQRPPLAVTQLPLDQDREGKGEHQLGGDDAEAHADRIGGIDERNHQLDHADGADRVEHLCDAVHDTEVQPEQHERHVRAVDRGVLEAGQRPTGPEDDPVAHSREQKNVGRKSQGMADAMDD
jgi:hypothetical protein